MKLQILRLRSWCRQSDVVTFQSVAQTLQLELRSVLPSCMKLFCWPMNDPSANALSG